MRTLSVCEVKLCILQKIKIDVSTFRHFDTFVVYLYLCPFLFTKINTKFKDKNLEPDDFMSTFAVSKVR